MSSKGGLGKGLGALMADAAEESGSNSTDNGRTELPLTSIVPNPNQPRTCFDDASLDELAASIAKDGLLQPLVVRKDGKKYQIVAGERRWQACKKLKMKTVPVTIIEADEAKTLELALIENLQRTNLNPIEEARGYKALISATGMKQDEVAQAVSKSRAAVTNALRLLDLPEEVQELLYDGKLTAGHARAILAVPDEEKRISLANRVVEKKLSVRDTEGAARLMASSGEERPVRPAAPRSYKNVARKLRVKLGTDVRVKNAGGKNTIEIQFADEADLERIYNLIDNQNAAQADE